MSHSHNEQRNATHKREQLSNYFSGIVLFSISSEMTQLGKHSHETHEMVCYDTICNKSSYH